MELIGWAGIFIIEIARPSSPHWRFNFFAN